MPGPPRSSWGCLPGPFGIDQSWSGPILLGEEHHAELLSNISLLSHDGWGRKAPTGGFGTEPELYSTVLGTTPSQQLTNAQHFTVYKDLVPSVRSTHFYSGISSFKHQVS
ncbi:hypothetical protein P7K49_025676 [Saguinus oedipus]|uniref:Uncharacterized protein n=1 Tax=Saguinus oedipus TaxID=9490 RepID=A0ABQ9UHV2_SAGOE|nr:hypothetical protein P7K49_025676 [Saguinus oedipus]